MFVRIKSSEFANPSSLYRAETIWLVVRPSIVSLARRASLLLIAFSVLVCAIPIALIIARAADGQRLLAFWHLLIIAAPPLLVIAIGTYVRFLRPLHLRLGTNGEQILVSDEKSNLEESVPIVDVYSDGEFLLIKDRLLPLQYLYNDAFERDKLLKYFIGRMPQTAYIARAALLWRAVRAGNRTLIGTFLLITFAVTWRLTLRL